MFAWLLIRECRWCGSRVPDGDGYVVGVQAYCTEEHAALDQAHPAI